MDKCWCGSTIGPMDTTHARCARAYVAGLKRAKLLLPWMHRDEHKRIEELIATVEGGGKGD